MSDWPIGLSTGCFYQISIFDCLERIRNAGFHMVEVCSSAAHLDFHDLDAVKRSSVVMRKLGMECYSFHAPFINVDISSTDNVLREYSLTEINRAAEAASVLGVRHFVIHPGPDNMIQFSVQERMERLKNAAEMLNIVALRCHELGVGLVLENMLPHLPFGSTSDMMWIMGAMKSLDICTCLDTGHALLSGDIYSVLYKLSGHLQIIHANDNRGRSDDHLPPGEGLIDWYKLLYELGETGFHGGMILELSHALDGDFDTTLESARQSRLFLRKICNHLYMSKPPSVDVPLYEKES